jgi:tyrosine-protein kinase Etk/Wzc
MALNEINERQQPSYTEQSLDFAMEKSNASFLDYCIVVAKRKFPILTFTAVAAAGAIVASLILPTVYTANTKILPPQQNQSMAAAMLGQLSPLIAMSAGKDLGIRNPNDLYVAMLRSRSVEDSLIDRFRLMEVYKSKLREDARRRLDQNTEIIARKDGVISISVEDGDKKRSADLANAYVSELERLTRTLAVTDAGKQRVFFEREVKAAQDELAKAEDSLKQTEERTGLVHLDNQSKVMLESVAKLRAQVAAKEVQVDSMRAFATPSNPDLKFAEQELTAIRAQVERLERGQSGQSATELPVSEIPSAGLEYVRRFREVKYREALLELLIRQYQVARIDEAKEFSIIQVLDAAVPPEKRSGPHRAAIVMMTTLLALMLAVLWSFAAEAWARSQEDPQRLAKSQLFRMYLFRRSRAKLS